MRKSGWISYIFMVLGIILICAASYVVINYSGQILGGAMEFFSSNDNSKFAQCGLQVPPQLTRLKADLVTAILPTLYIGFPFFLIVLSAIMFIGGFYYNRAKTEEEVEKAELAEKEAMRRVVAKIVSEKGGKPKSVPKEDTDSEREAPLDEDEPQQSETEES